MRALPARRSTVTLWDRKESVSAVIDGFSTQSSLLFSFQGLKPLPLGGADGYYLEKAIKTPTFRRARKRSHFVGSSTLCAPLGFQVVSRHQLEKYSTSPRGVKPEFQHVSMSARRQASPGDLSAFQHFSLNLSKA